MSKFTILIFLLVSVLDLKAQCPELVWSDEFDGEELDQSKWTYQIGDGCDIQLCGWGNNELQSYTSNNLTVREGKAVISARREEIGNSSYSSTRIRSLNKGEVKFGRIEARIKLPKGQGIWPAFWMLPSENVYGIWPQSGEIDIMEYRGQEENVVHGTIHFGQAWPNNQSSTKTFTVSEGTFSEGFNDFALEWTDQSLKWFVNGYLYSTKTRSDLNGQRWPFDQDFHLLLNMAVGGNFSGNPDGSTSFPQEMEVDYVRVYDMVDLPYLSGPQTVENKAQKVFYRINNLTDAAVVEWILPEEAELVEGQGTNVIEVNWNNNGGKIIAKITDGCGISEMNLSVRVSAPIASEATLENFDEEGSITRTSNSGNFKEDVNNPGENEVNSSALCGEYTRSGSDLFDVIFYNISDVRNGADFITGEKIFFMDLYTDAPIGTKVLLQLEDKSRANTTNYPTGRHSRYEVSTTKQNEWERLEFPLLDRPDGSTSHQRLDQLVILFAPNTNNNSTYYFDNFEIYSETTTTSIEEIDFRLQITPNPVINNLFLDLDKGYAIQSIEVFDYTSKRVKMIIPAKTNSYQMNLSDLRSGIYYVKVQTTDDQYIMKTIFKS